MFDQASLRDPISYAGLAMSELTCCAVCAWNVVKALGGSGFTITCEPSPSGLRGLVKESRETRALNSIPLRVRKACDHRNLFGVPPLGSAVGGLACLNYSTPSFSPGNRLTRFCSQSSRSLAASLCCIETNSMVSISSRNKHGIDMRNDRVASRCSRWCGQDRKKNSNPRSIRP